MKKIFMIFFAGCILSGCQSSTTTELKEINEGPALDMEMEKANINAILDSFNLAAARADYDQYFSFYDSLSVFMGTDATERWNKGEFMVWAKPFFDKGTAWNFTAIDRHIDFDQSGRLAWFDELLKTQMKICRGSGVMVYKDGTWKIKQYVLSMTIPNSLVDSVVSLKSKEEDLIMTSLEARLP